MHRLNSPRITCSYGGEGSNLESGAASERSRRAPSAEAALSTAESARRPGPTGGRGQHILVHHLGGEAGELPR